MQFSHCELFTSYGTLREDTAILFLFLLLRPGNSPLYFMASGCHTVPYLSAQAIQHSEFAVLLKSHHLNIY